MATTFDPDEYELRWPPQLFIDEANHLRRYTISQVDEMLGIDRFDWAPEMEWLLTEAFVSTVPTETLKRVLRSSVHWGGPNLRGAEQWISQLLEEAPNFPQPRTRKPNWSARTSARPTPARLKFTDVTRHFVRLVEEFEANSYLVNAFGQECVDDYGPRPDPSAVLESRLGVTSSAGLSSPAGPVWEVDDFCELVEVLHDLVARPSRRWYHDESGCGWHYKSFATRPARRLYRWQVNRLLAGSDLGLRLAEEGEDLGRLVRVEPTGLEDLPEKALQAARPETVDRVQHAIALFRSRKATVEERRSAVITLVGILEERRPLLKAKLVTEDERALFRIANEFADRPHHQRADQRSDYDNVYLDWLFWWYLATVYLTDQLIARQAAAQT